MKVPATLILFFLFPCYYCLPSCDKLCPQNQVYSSQVSQCQTTCWNKRSTVMASYLKAPGCKCRNGYLRHPDTYECIPESSCPKQTNHAQCGKNEIYSICSTNTRPCERTCYKKNEDSKICACKSQCVCKTGYFRSSVTNQCILGSECKSM